ncbi:MAG: phage holin family protein [Sedimentitalea sp.]|nr:phage holin family protein [Sedimentitalea sp.]
MRRVHNNLLVILRAERMIARRHVTVLRNQTGLLLFAGFVATIGLVMLNLAAYQALSTVMGSQYAALIVALVNLGIAGGLAWAAMRMSADRDLTAITELRDLAIADLEAEVDEVADEAQQIAGNLRRIVRDPLGSVAAAVLGTILGARKR